MTPPVFTQRETAPRPSGQGAVFRGQPETRLDRIPARSPRRAVPLYRHRPAVPTIPPVTPNDDADGRLSGQPPTRPPIDPDRLARHIRAQVAEAPPLSASRIERLRGLFTRPRVNHSEMRR